jgi:hypothetical protein
MIRPMRLLAVGTSYRALRFLTTSGMTNVDDSETSHAQSDTTPTTPATLKQF